MVQRAFMRQGHQGTGLIIGTGLLNTSAGRSPGVVVDDLYLL